MKKFTLLMLFLAASTFGVKAQTITHSTSQEISDATGVACSAGGIVSDNSYYRSFVLADFGIASPWMVSSVEVGVETLSNTPAEGYDFTVTLYTTDAAFPTGNLTEIATVTNAYFDMALTIISVPISANIPAGSELVVKFSMDVSDQVTFYPGANELGQTAPVYISSDGCAITDPTDMADIGFPDMAWVLNVVGAPGEGNVVSNPSDCGVGISIADNTCPDNDTTGIAVSGVPGGVMGDNLYLSDVNIIIMHTWDGDLEIRLQSPSGVTVDLSIGNGSSGDNYGDTTGGGCVDVTNFNMSAATSIVDGDAPYIGSFMPEGDFADFNDGGDANGIWRLLICDAANGDTGTVEYVELVFTQPCPDPSDLAAANVTTTTADLSWVENGSATQWEVEVVESGTAPTGVGTVTSDNPYAASGLASLTDYDFYVRALCADPDMSGWASGSFTTLVESNNGDDCVDALEIVENGQYTVDPLVGTGATSSGGIAVAAAWFVFTAPDDGLMTVTSCLGGADTRLWIYTGDCGALVDFADTDDDCEYEAGSFEYAASLEGLAVTSGTTYLIEWDDRWSSDGFVFDFLFEGPDAVSELAFDKNVSVYPNPVSSLLTVDVNADINAGSIISLVNLQGKVIYNETVSNSVSGYRTEIDMSSFAKGIYVLKLEDENSSIQKKIILQ